MSTLQVHVDKPVTQASTDIRPIHTTLEPRFLRSDYVPTAAERSQLKKVLEGGEEQVKRYEEEIELLPHRLDELEAAKNTVEATNTQCRDALSTRRRTPVEIWEMVFEVLCLSLHEYSFCVSYDSSKECPAMLVSQVCSLWRIIANGMPGIWSSLDVDLDWPYNIEIPLELYLSNSKGCSLKIRIEGGVFLQTQGFDTWRTLSTHFYRVHKLVMAYDRCEELPPVITSTGLTFPNLESLYEERYIPENGQWPWFWTAIQRAPKLSIVTSRSSCSKLPFSQLTVWEISKLDYYSEINGFLEIVGNCRCLTALTISAIVSYYGVSARAVELPSLRQFTATASGDWAGWLSTIAESLIMPSLEMCDIRCESWDPPPGLLILAERASLSLKQLSLTLRTDSGEDPHSNIPLFEVLQVTCELTKLELFLVDTRQNHWPLIDDRISKFLIKLEESSDRTRFLPRLSVLSLDVQHMTLNMHVVEGILGAVSARQLKSHPLTDFCLVRRERVKGIDDEQFVICPDALERIRTLEEESGIKVVIEDRRVAGI